MKLIFVFSAILIIACADELSDCKCGPGLEARQTGDGTKCVGILTKIILPCNIERLPRCLCTGDVTAVVNSLDEGSYCLQNENGKEKKRWPCENKEDWDAFNKEKEESGN